MRSLLGPVLDKLTTAGKGAPVPYTGRRAGLSGIFGGAGSGIGGNREAQAAAYGANGTLYAITGGISLDVSAVKWKLWDTTKASSAEERTEVTSHAAWTVWNKPNPFMRRQRYVELVQLLLELTGEGPQLVARNRLASWPVELWPVYPHRMAPVPDGDKFLAGYVYTSPDGEQVPLDVADVGMLLQPHPLDFLRGLGVIAAIGTDLDSAGQAAEWNRNFFRNSAQPGGIIEFPQELTDDEFETLRFRWRDQHQGVANAHRVAMIEMGGKWVDRGYSMRDLQFVELRGVSDEAVRRGYRYPKSLLGDTDEGNRAIAIAQERNYGKRLLVPRLERWKDWLNNEFLPAFGPTADGLEFDYVSPVPEDAEAENAARDSKANAAKTYTDAGWEPNSVKEALGLPAALVWKGAPQPAPALPTGGDGAAAGSWDRIVSGLVTLDPQPILAAVIPPELARVQQDWETALDRLVADWQAMTAGQRDRLVDQVRAAVEHGDLQALTALTVPSQQQADLLAETMAALATTAGRRVADEADEQGVSVSPALWVPAAFAAAAAVAAGLAVSALALSAGREALRWAGYGRTPADVADGVGMLLEGLSDAPVRASLGGALTWAQNRGRIETLRAAPEATYWATEILDTNTCKPCREINGKQLPTLDAANLAYGGGGYLMCLGTIRCRGTMKAVWGDEQS